MHCLKVSSLKTDQQMKQNLRANSDRLQSSTIKSALLSTHLFFSTPVFLLISFNAFVTIFAQIISLFLLVPLVLFAACSFFTSWPFLPFEDFQSVFYAYSTKKKTEKKAHQCIIREQLLENNNPKIIENNIIPVLSQHLLSLL